MLVQTKMPQLNLQTPVAAAAALVVVVAVAVVSFAAAQRTMWKKILPEHVEMTMNG